MMDPEIVKDLHQKLSSGDAREQAQSALHIRDLCAEKEEYRATLGSVVAPLVGLLDAAPGSQPLTHTAAQALAYLAECEEHRDMIRWGSAIASLRQWRKSCASALSVHMKSTNKVLG